MKMFDDDKLKFLSLQKNVKLYLPFTQPLSSNEYFPGSRETDWALPITRLVNPFSRPLITTGDGITLKNDSSWIK